MGKNLVGIIRGPASLRMYPIESVQPIDPSCSASSGFRGAQSLKIQLPPRGGRLVSRLGEALDVRSRQNRDTTPSNTDNIAAATPGGGGA